VDGQGSTDPGGSNDDKIFFMKYPIPFLKYCHLLRLQSLSFIKMSCYVCMNLSVRVRTTQVSRYFSMFGVSEVEN